MLSKRRVIEEGIAKWAPRVGWRAARLQVESADWGVHARTILLLWMAVYFVGELARSTVVVVISVVIVAVGLGCFARSLWLRHLYRQVGSAHLGVRLSWRAKEGVPLDSARYEQWCRDNGLVPYAAATDSPDRPT